VARNPRLESALQFAAAGVNVAPALGKNPGALLGHDWPPQATTDERTIRGWWERWENANVGIVPGLALLPVDVDIPSSFARFQAEHGTAPPTPRYLTNGEPGVVRERLLFAHPGRRRAHTHLCAGAQLRDGSLFSVVPPSVNPDSGEPYEWVAAFDELPLAPLPSTWLAVLPDRKPPVERDEFATPVTAGDRHDRLLRLAGYLIAKDIKPSIAVELLCGWNRRYCRPPKNDEREIAAIVEYAFEREGGVR
jgi:hypothetical protein